MLLDNLMKQRHNSHATTKPSYYAYGETDKPTICNSRSKGKNDTACRGGHNSQRGPARTCSLYIEMALPKDAEINQPESINGALNYLVVDVTGSHYRRLKCTWTVVPSSYDSDIPKYTKTLHTLARMLQNSIHLYSQLLVRWIRGRKKRW
jgi:hypothetical protein